MPSKRLTPILAGFTGVLLAAAIAFILTDGVDRARAEGERLSIRRLRLNEEIIVSTLFSHRATRGREYRLRAQNGKVVVRIFDTTPEWSRDDPGGHGAVLFARELSNAEIDGLEEMVAYFRQTREQSSSATQHVRLQHFRDGRRIGEEFYIGFSLSSQLSHYDREGLRGDPRYAHDYDRLAREHGITPARLARMISFEMLEKETPNPALAPIP